MEFILENLGKIGFEWKMALFNLVNFLILFLILKRYFFAPIMKNIREREDQVNDSVDNIQKAKTEIQMAERRAQEIVDMAKVEANKVAERAFENAKHISADMTERAQKEIEILVAQAKRMIAKEKAELRAGLEQEMGKLIVLAVEKIIAERLDEKKDQSIITKALQSASSSIPK